MGKVKYTKKYRKIKDIRADITKFAELHFVQQFPQWDGFIGIKKKSGKWMKNEFAPRQSVFTSHINEHQYFGKKDLYVSKNAHIGIPVTKDSVLGFINIVIDIDAHQIVPEAMEEETEKLRYFLFSGEIADIPMPNTIVYTGRGVQLWYSIHSLAAKLSEPYEKVSRHIASVLSEAISSSPALSNFQVDMASSCKTAGLYRMPGTYNSKSDCYGSVEFIHDEKLDVLSFCNYEMEHEPRQYHRQTNGDYRQLARIRENAIRKLIRIREQAGEDTTGMRDLYCFVFFNVSFTGDLDYSLKQTMDLNKSFKHPLSESKLMSYLSSSIKKAKSGDAYHMTNKKIIDYLNITPEECRLIGFSEKKKKPVKRPGLTKKISDDIVKIINNLAKLGLNKSQIAKAVEVSVTTVSNYLKKSNIKTHKETNQKKMEMATRRGMGMRKFMSHFGVSKSMYYYIKDKIRKEKEKSQNEKKAKSLIALKRKAEQVMKQKKAKEKMFADYKKHKEEIREAVSKLIGKYTGQNITCVVGDIKKKTGFSKRNIRLCLQEYYPDINFA